ncbi:hypothetical protein DCM90_03470 [Levilactobacillus bambusae]|uniref:Uncharacterized protein n=1 Tax=Levilactobacillus bambusae TaxID=2024736 RepID=A0A2V1N120_9LACO|nr:hypothetical protein DCM90_03470 [Levilactobacillus bambusae]
MNSNLFTGALIVTIGIILCFFCIHLARLIQQGDTDGRWLTSIFIGVSLLLVCLGGWIITLA